jgi:hypothetical protein
MFANYSSVNGQLWPYLDVEPTRYRFRIVNGCNSRFLRLKVMVDLPDEGRFDDDCDGSEDPIKVRERQGVNMTGPCERHNARHDGRQHASAGQQRPRIISIDTRVAESLIK